ncbi:MAG: guanosine monophosphate reductase [Flavobacteriaceae bacterium]|nr:guanosine monophosphate reductase [Flavobacteriaceae bacterium]
MQKQTVSFDDVLLTPQYSDIKSRSEVSISSKLGYRIYSLPIISSPMDTVTGTAMSWAMGSAGGLGIVHRYCSIQQQVKMTAPNSAAAIGVTGDFLERAQALYDSGVQTFCLDVAHGHHVLMKTALEKLRSQFSESVTLVAGNVATAQGYADLSEWGADAVRIGIGGGSICSTRIQTGHGVPTFQSVLDCRDVDGATIIADGGIRTAGDIVKVLAAGADFVMLGSMLAGTDQSPGDAFQNNEGKKYKVYRGMASVEAQKDWRGEARSLEGISTTIPYKGSVVEILESLATNIKSGLSYSGARTIRELQAKAKFIGQTAAGQSESNTHILGRK